MWEEVGTMPTAARRIGLIQQLLKPEMAPNGMHRGGLLG